MKIGVFGGSFNPPHHMHKQLVRDLINKSYVDKIIIVPTGDYYQKKELIPFDDRYHMVKLMIEDMKQVEVSNFEEKGSLIYTYQTLEYFQEKYPNDEIYFILGSDNLKELNTWKKADEMIQRFKFLVVLRNQDSEKDISYYISKKKEHFIVSHIKEGNISSTKIREEFHHHNNSDFLNEWLDEKVLSFIQKKNIYKRR